MTPLMQKLASVVCLGFALPALGQAPALPAMTPTPRAVVAPIAAQMGHAAQPARVGPAAAGGFQAAPLAVCATGFAKTGEQRNGQTTAVLSFQCTTPVITCPRNPDLPGVTLDVQVLTDNPEGSTKRIRYTCRYFPLVP